MPLSNCSFSVSCLTSQDSLLMQALLCSRVFLGSGSKDIQEQRSFFVGLPEASLLGLEFVLPFHNINRASL